MLRITMSKSSAGAQKYYSEAYYSEGQEKELNYYSEKGHVIGTWGGIGAAKLNLNGDILKEDFGALCDNINPVTGKKLTARNDLDRTVGYDFTFNASKSISLAYSLGNEDDRLVILNAFRNSVKDTMSEIETGMQARVRDNRKNENRETGNIVYGEFVHFTTRPIDGVPDPHLHSHCFVLNQTYDEKAGKWKAGQFRQLKQDAPYYEAVFHANLANKLQEQGYVVVRTENGFELAGVDKGTIDKFSRRTKEIEEHAREHGITNDKQKSEIGARTRESKRTDISHDKQEEEWKQRLESHEFAGLQNLRKKPAGFNNAEQNDNAASDALQYSLNHHLERKSVASDKEILTTAIKSSIGTAKVEHIKKAFNRDNNIIKVTENLRSFITTKEALREEKELINNANSLKGRFRPINENYELKGDFLNEQQKAAVKHALTTTDGISIVTGKAGTGKTTLMQEVQKAILESGKLIYSFAPSSDASRGVQRSEGFENADTVASLIQNKSRHEEFKNQVIWVDEAGQLSNKDLNKIIGIAKAQNARIILSGDTRQHNSVWRGDALRIIQKYTGIRSITISKIQRQKNNDYREAVKQLSNGNIEKGFKKLDSIGSIKEVQESAERVQAIAMDYYSSAYTGKNATKNVLVIAPTHAEGETVTRAIRGKLKENDVIGKEDREYNILKSLQFTEAEKQKTEKYNSGNVIVFHQNIKGVKAGTRLDIVGYENENLLAKESKGTTFNIPVSQSHKFNVFEVRQIAVTKGDRIRVTNNGYAEDGKHLFNGTCYNINGFDRQGNIKLSNGSTISKDFGHFNFGYVMTSHSSQGKTADKVIVSQSSNTFRASSMEQFYVSVSRGKQAVSIYTDDKDSLLQAVSQSGQRISATELLSRNGLNNKSSLLTNTINKAREAIEKYRAHKKQENDLQRTPKPGIRKGK